MGERPESGDRRDVLRRALALIRELEQRLAVAERPGAEPIAIVGMACRFPGGVNSPPDYWRLLERGGDAICPFPAERGGDDADGRTLFGGFIDRIDQFDASFFGITPREARLLDPQQRLLLETAWTALEDAGQAPDGLSGSRTGVFVGITTTEYHQLIDEVAPALSDVYGATGNALHAAAGRISFVLGLQGPCMAVDTACSSSLVGIHTACRSLKVRDCDLALAGGVNVIVRPEASRMAASWGLMAADGRCKTFDAAADGFVRSDGCALLVLRRLSDAQARGDRILAVIAGSAVNQDGRSSGLTVPNGLAQEALIRAALADAGLVPGDVDYVEAHGTGTPIGDPIEIEALAGALGAGRSADRPLLLGSVKTNIGHAESASGVAGLMKVVLSLQHETIPAHLHFTTPSPAIPWDLAPLEVVTRATPWPMRQGRRRVAGISSFGFSGTNAHIILAEAPAAGPMGTPANRPRSTHVLTLSARHPDSLRELAAAYVERLAAVPDTALADVCHSANTGRARLSERLAVAVTSSRQAVDALAAWLSHDAAPAVFHGSSRPSQRPRIAFLFTGQGSQHAGMGRGLYETSAVFREAIDDCAGRLSGHMDRPLLDVMFGGDAGLIDETAYAQPALFALEYALAAQWRAWGVVPDVVLGHSVGEIVAATVADVMTLDDGLRLVAARGRLMQALPRVGTMAAVFADPAVVRAALAGLDAQASIAAVNGPEHVVISGSTEAVAAVLARLEARGVRHVPLKVSHAFHSPLMDPALDQLERVARDIGYSDPQRVLLSNVTGGEIRALAASYWRQHAREPVQFCASIRHLEAQGVDVTLELGPSATLSGLVDRIRTADRPVAISSMRHGRQEWQVMCEAVAELHVRGAAIDWNSFDTGVATRRVQLPPTPFRRQRFWVEDGMGSGHTPRRARQTEGHPLLGAPLVLAATPDCWVWEQEISLERLPFLADHRVRGRAVLPATAYVEMAMAAMEQRVGWTPLSLHDIDFKTALILEPSVTVTVQVTLSGTPGDLRFSVHSRPSGRMAASFVEHVTGRVTPLPVNTPDGWSQDYLESRDRCDTPLASDAFYERMAEAGNDWGPTFRGPYDMRFGSGEACAIVEPQAGVREDLGRYVFHPALADACGHVLIAAAAGACSPGDSPGAVVGRRIEEIRIYRPARGRSFRVSATLRAATADAARVTGDVFVVDEDGLPVAETRGVTLQALGAPQRPAVALSDWFYGVDWEPASIPDDMAPASTCHVMLLGSEAPAAEAIVEHLRAAGIRAERVPLEASDRPAPISRERAEAIISRLRPAQDSSPGHIVYVAPATPPDIDSVDDLEARVLADCGSVLHLAQALATHAATTTAPGQLWVVTHRGVRVAAEQIAVAQAPLWGLGRSLATECGKVWGGLVDLDDARGPEDQARAIARALGHAGPEREVAFRDIAYVPRLARRQLATTSEPFVADAGGAYLITGGFGGLGLVVADWLARRGARHVVLAGRRVLPDRARWDELAGDDPHVRAVAAVRALEQQGVAIRMVAADIGSAIEVRRLLRDLSDDGVRLCGIVHAAGVEEHSPLAGQSVESLRRLFAGKVRGAWLLARECPDVPALVLFSSASALFGPPFLGGYAAANAFLDALALNGGVSVAPLSSPGSARRLLSVNWGRWAAVGMAARAEARDGRFSELTEAMTPEQGIAALEQALSSGITQVAVLPVDWGKWRRGVTGAIPFYSRVVGGGPSPAGGPLSTPSSAGIAPAVPTRTDDGDVLRAEIERVMELGPGTLDLDEPLVTLGLDSLMAVELRSAIEVGQGISVPLDRILGGATARDIIGEIVRRGTPTRAAELLPRGVIEEGEF